MEEIKLEIIKNIFCQDDRPYIYRHQSVHYGACTFYYAFKFPFLIVHAQNPLNQSSRPLRAAAPQGEIKVTFDLSYPNSFCSARKWIDSAIKKWSINFYDDGTPR